MFGAEGAPGKEGVILEGEVVNCEQLVESQALIRYQYSVFWNKLVVVAVKLPVTAGGTPGRLPTGGTLPGVESLTKLSVE